MIMLTTRESLRVKMVKNNRIEKKISALVVLVNQNVGHLAGKRGSWFDCVGENN